MSLDTEFPGTTRYEVTRRIGAGAMGTVYEAVDRERGAPVALKLLRRAGGGGIYRFKQEFRALADVAHRNLVTLHELVADGDAWFFTMELIDGISFLRYVRGEDRAADALAETVTPPTLEGSTVTTASSGGGAATPAEAAPLAGDAAFARLRRALRELAEGVDALHRAGRLHRDIKPSNALVDPTGRVVLLDFGLVTDERGAGDDRGEIVGTPAYMAPEQAEGRAVSTASDWYSVGVVLFEALTGRLPFTGDHRALLVAKRSRAAPTVAALAPAAPDDLAALCDALLARDPAARPIAEDVLRALGAAPAIEVSPPQQVGALVGREPIVDELRAALARAQGGAATIALVEGASGMGKSTVVRHFLDRVDALVLDGRCYERESVPYKAVDSAIDALSRALRKLPTAEVERLLESDAGAAALGRLFPVLWRVPAIAALRERVPDVADPTVLRRRAFGALRALFTELSRRRAIVLYIDDLQWGDVDSAALLAELLREPDPPAMLVVGCYRTEAADTPLVVALRDASALTLKVGPLAPADAERLAASCGASAGEAAAIAREAGGHPYFVVELARHRAALGETVNLDGLLSRRIAALPADARALLELVSVAARPLPMRVFARASSLDDAETAAATLRAGHFIRSRGARDTDGISAFHDRVRETVVAGLDAGALAARHRAIALALEASDDADPEAMAEHYAAAGEAAIAADYARRAARAAEDALAFDRAARLYRMAIALRGELATRELSVRLGEALVNAGRGGDAAEVFLQAAVDAPAADALDLERRAAEAYLVSGYVDEGMQVVERVLDTVGYKLPGTRTRALGALLAGRAGLRLGGLRYRERDASQVSPETLRRIDACWSVAVGLAFIDNLRAGVFHTRHLRMALRVGEPYRVARGLAFEAAVLSTLSESGRKRAAPLIERAHELATRVNSDHVLALCEYARHIGPAYAGDWLTAYEHCRNGLELMRERCVGVEFERTTALISMIVPLFYMGRFAELARVIPEQIAEGKERSNRYLQGAMRTGLANLVWLARDQPVAAREQASWARDSWSKRGVHILPYDLMANVHIDLYLDDAAAAWERCQRRWGEIDAAGLFRLQRVRIEQAALRGRAALACAEASGDAAALADAVAQARALEREHLPWASAQARLLRAGIGVRKGDHKSAVAWLRAAESAFDQAGMRLFSALARRRRGELVGGGQGADLIAAADRFVRSELIRSPERFAALLAPGFG